MAQESKIQWTDATWNPWHGCTKVSPGCKFCYMYRDKERYGHDPKTVLRSKTKFHEPLSWKEPRKVFTCSWSDFFVEDADEWRKDAWEVIRQTPQHTYQILTKRANRIHKCLPRWFEALDNVWIGVSVESQAQIHRISYLEDLPGIRFVSFEPLIGPITLQYNNCIDWAIIGGESGNETGKYKYRPCHSPWINSLVHQCRSDEIPVFVKQLGTYLAKEMGMKDRHGGNLEEWPEHMQIREFPKIVTA